MFNRARICTLLGLVLAAAPVMFAPTTFTWTGTTTQIINDGTITNWLGGVAPVSGNNADLVFGVPANPSPQSGMLKLLANSTFDVASVTFNSSFPAYSFSPSITESTAVLAVGAGGIQSTGTSNVIFGPSLTLQLNASQTWTTTGNLVVSGPISGTANLTKSGTGILLLGGDSPDFTGDLIVTSGGGALYLGKSDSAGSGNLILQNGTTLAPTANSISLSNNVTVSDSVTFAKALGFFNPSPNTPSITIDGSVTAATSSVGLHLLDDITLQLNGGLTGIPSSNTSVTFDSGGMAILAGTTDSTIASITADGAGVIFAASNALPSASIQAAGGGYIGIGATSSSVPSITDMLALITNKAAFNGTFGFDSDPTLPTPHVYDGTSTTPLPLDFSGFTTTTFRIGSATSAVIGVYTVITPPANDYRFGGGGGLLEVESNLTDNGGTPRTLTVTSPVGKELTLWLAGSNSFTGAITIDNSLLRFANAGALPSPSPTLSSIIIPSTSRGAYLGFDYDLSASDLSALASRIVLSGGQLVLGFDSASLTNLHTVAASIDLGNFPANTILGTATIVTVSSNSTVTPAGGEDAPYRFAAVDHGSLTVDSQLTDAVGARAVEIGIANTSTSFSPGTNKGPNNVTITNDANNYSGGTTIFDGVVHLTTSSTSLEGVIQKGPLGTGPITIAASATNASLQPDSRGGDPITVTLDNPITANSNVSVGDLSLGNTIVLNGAISGPARLSLLGKVTLGTANSYLGGTDLSQNAIVTVNSNTGLSSGDVNFGYGAIVTFTTNAPSIGSLSDSGSYMGGIVLPADASSLAITQTKDGTFTGNISGPSSGMTTATLVKNGSNGLTLSGTGIYTGGTTINGGNLAAGSSIALGSGSVTINNGAKLSVLPGVVLTNPIVFGSGGSKLGGSGTFAPGGSLGIGNGTVLTPGNGTIGTLTFGTVGTPTNLTWDSGGALKMGFQNPNGPAGSGTDLIYVNGTLTINSTSIAPFTVSLWTLDPAGNQGVPMAGFNPGQSYNWQIAGASGGILNFDSTKLIFDTSNFMNSLGGGNLSFSLSGDNTALFLNFTPVPEPSTWALLLCGAGAVLLPALRRRKSEMSNCRPAASVRSSKFETSTNG
jgi:autotransporter-associated beta strand protein